MRTIKKCSPHINNNYNSCLKPDIIKKIGKILNLKSKNIMVLHNLIKKRLESKCSNEMCWIKIRSILNNLTDEEIRDFKNSFRPKRPISWYSNKNEWLSSLDLDRVMKQYESKYPFFKYFKSTPIDYHLKGKNGNCKVSKLCNFNLEEEINNGKTFISTIFNTDYHYEPGSHWVAFVIDVEGKCNKKKPSIYYFDPTGDSQPKEISKLIRDVKKQGKELKINFKKHINKKQHQIEDTECGIYCLHFIKSLLLKKDYNDYVNNIKRDNYIEKYRNFFFN